jgi:hypothetical protein
MRNQKIEMVNHNSFVDPYCVINLVNACFVQARLKDQLEAVHSQFSFTNLDI